jgi:RNA polymerase sigma-70 factor (ECF subfamily)
MAKDLPSDNDELQLIAGGGDGAALKRLLDRHRERLERMVAVRMDRRLARRVDPADVIQETLVDAIKKLEAYLRERPLPFYPWLRRLAFERLVQLHRHHIGSSKRSMEREQSELIPLPDESAVLLVDRLVAGGSSPSSHWMREARRERVRQSLERLPPNDREVLVLRYVEDLPFAEVARALGMGLGAVKMRHLRALQRLRDLLKDESWGGQQ